MNELADRVIKARRDAGLSQAQLARAVGVSQQSIQKLEDGLVRRTRYLLEIADALKVNPEWLSSGKGQVSVKEKQDELKMAGPAVPRGSADPLDSDEVELPVFKEVELAVGGGRTAVVEDRDFKQKITKSVLLNAGVATENAALAYIIGNPMEPFLKDGDTVAVDKSDVQIKDGKLYVIDHNGMLRIKQLYRMPGGGFKISSFNKSEHPDEIYGAEYFVKNIRVMGRVFWSDTYW